MSDKEKILKTLSSLIETGILTANDVKKELVTNFKFKKTDFNLSNFDDNLTTYKKPKK